MVRGYSVIRDGPMSDISTVGFTLELDGIDTFVGVLEGFLEGKCVC
jgi:hypothetical protein